MNQQNNHELDALINACLEGQLDETEAAKLSDLIENSAPAWNLQRLHGLGVQSSARDAGVAGDQGGSFREF